MSRIFFLEVTVFRLCIDERIIRDANGDTNFIVKINLIGIPGIIIRRDESSSGLSAFNDNFTKNMDYYAGCACHFIAKRQEIVNFMKMKPLRIGIYRDNERFPICDVVVPFSGCVCDLVSGDIEQPSPFEFHGIFDLTEPGGNPAGHLCLGIVLTDLGKHVVTAYALVDRRSFILKNDPEGAEYKCRVSKNDYNKENDSYSTIDECPVDYSRENFIREIAGISLISRSLSRGKPEVKEVLEPLGYDQEESDAIKVKRGKTDEKKIIEKKIINKTKKR